MAIFFKSTVTWGQSMWAERRGERSMTILDWEKEHVHLPLQIWSKIRSGAAYTARWPDPECICVLCSIPHPPTLFSVFCSPLQLSGLYKVLYKVLRSHTGVLFLFLSQMTIMLHKKKSVERVVSDFSGAGGGDWARNGQLCGRWAEISTAQLHWHALKEAGSDIIIHFCKPQTRWNVSVVKVCLNFHIKNTC